MYFGNFLVYLITIILAWQGIVSFEIWGQIHFLSEMENLDLSSKSIIVHAPRFYLISPVYFLSSLLDLSVDYLFTLYALTSLFATSCLWRAVRELNYGISKSDLIISLFPFLLIPFINGRFAFGIFGLSWLLYFIVSNIRYGVTLSRLLQLIPIFFLINVSSGIFSLALLLLIATLNLQWKSYLDRREFISYIEMTFFVFLFISILVILIYFMVIFLDKNIVFYGGGISGVFAMLGHGLGFLINPNASHAACLDVYSTSINCQISELMFYSPLISMIVNFLVFLIILFISLLVISNSLNKVEKLFLVSFVFVGAFGFLALMSLMYLMPVLVVRRSLRFKGFL